MDEKQYKDIKEDKEISELIDHIKKLSEQIENPEREKMIEELKELRKSDPISTEIIEWGSVNFNSNMITDINNIDNKTLYDKLFTYKEFCIGKLIEKIGKKQYEEIKKKENW